MISESYLAQQRLMHDQCRYGHSGKKWGLTVETLCWKWGAQTVLDYGCGTGAMVRRLRTFPGNICREVFEYDPAISGKDSMPHKADLVACIDVLEHIEPVHLDQVLAHLRYLSVKLMFVVIATRLAGKILPDGRNAHLIVKNEQWWQERMVEAGFRIDREWMQKPGEWCAELA